ncbi:hypothetical protein FACS1894190_10050 [Spirochaetia bacterium]|nr:hypothetical protein FACS1894190_10050 [Spirochaetia bacterium]
MSEPIVEKLKKLESVITEYDEIITEDMKNLRKEYAVMSSEKLSEKLNEEKEKGKVLTIGIIGKVNSGKSSLLNSVFFNGEDVLPKAATPMTASLTVLTYGDTFSANVEYFSANEIEDIKKGHNSYKIEFEKLYEEKKKDITERYKKRGKTVSATEIEEDARKSAVEAMSEKGHNDAFYDQYERMLKSGIAPNTMGNKTTEKIAAKNLGELMGLMNDYVGYSGKKMPYTKSVEIQLAGEEFKSLENICVVDTPGVNDPVRSREQRTEEYLSECDVVFIVSPAGSFITANDMDLMDRLSSKEGVQELYLVASRADSGVNQGSVIAEAKGDLNAAKTSISKTLLNTATNNLTKLKNDHPEIKDQFDKLVNESSDRFILLSAICNAMKLRFSNKNTWDGDMNTAWRNLSKNYPAYFGDDQSENTNLANLDSLSNITLIKNKIEFARSEKNNIIAKHQKEQLDTQSSNIEQFKTELQRSLEQKQEEIKNEDLQKIQDEKTKLEQRLYRGADAIDDAFDDCFSKFKEAVKKAATHGTKSEIQTALSTARTQTEEGVDRWHERRGGIIGAIAKFFGMGEYVEKSRSYTAIRPGAVHNSILLPLVNGLQMRLADSVEEAKKEWERSMPRTIIEEYQTVIGNDANDDTDRLRYALRNVLNNMEIPLFDFSSLPFKGTRSGTLRNDAVNDFLEEVYAYLGELDLRYRTMIEGTLKKIEKKLKRQKISELLFEDVQKQINELENNIKNKTYILDKLAKCLTAIKGIE